jgi:hypothetical protein
MLGYYGKEEAENGDCGNWDNVQGRSHELSDCANTALELSEEHANNQQ